MMFRRKPKLLANPTIIKGTTLDQFRENPSWETLLEHLCGIEGRLDPRKLAKADKKD